MNVNFQQYGLFMNTNCLMKYTLNDHESIMHSFKNFIAA